jgi:hypothetical protein
MCVYEKGVTIITMRVTDDAFGTDRAGCGAHVQGRITERQLPEAERCLPGITRFYASLAKKPVTFLDLLWQFEGYSQRCKSSRKRSRR